MRGVTYALFLFALAMGLLALDFVSKAYISQLFPFAYNVLGETSTGAIVADLPIFKAFLGGIDFSITLAHNTGIAWGLFADFSWVILILRLLVVLSFILYLCFWRKQEAPLLPFILILTGAIGNIVDFFLYGHVIDFMRFDLWGYPFPIFNVADTLITLGVGALVCLSLLPKRRFISPS